MKLSDLNKIDIKDLQKIDFAKIQENLLQKPLLLIKTLLIVISLLVTIKVMANSLAQVSQIKNKIADAEKKLSSIKEKEDATKELKIFLDSRKPGLSADTIVDNIADFAAARNIQILSFTPAKEVNKTVYTLTSLNLNVSAVDYKTMIQFIHDIESAPYALKVVHWTGLMGADTASSTAAEKSDNQSRPIIAQIEINSVNYIK